MNPISPRTPQPHGSDAPDALDDWLRRAVPTPALDDDGFSAAVMRHVETLQHAPAAGATAPAAAHVIEKNTHPALAGIENLAINTVAFDQPVHRMDLRRSVGRWLRRESLPTALLLAASAAWLVTSPGLGSLGAVINDWLQAAPNATAPLQTQPLLAAMGLAGLCWASWRYVKR